MGLLSTIFPAVDDAEAIERCGDAGPSGGVDLGGMTPLELETLLESITGAEVEPDLARDLDAGDERWLSEVPPELVTALAGLAPDAVGGVAERWAETEELAGVVDPADLASVITDLRTLATSATTAGARLYLWTSL